MIKKILERKKKHIVFLLKNCVCMSTSLLKKKKSTRTQNKIMKKGIRKITSKTYWKKEESNGNYWEVEQ